MPKLLPKDKIPTAIPLSLAKTKYFPSINRFIPELTLFQAVSPHWLKLSISLIISGVFLILTVNQYILFIKNQEFLSVINLERAKISRELIYWREMSVKFNNHPDIYLKIASLEYKLGYTDSAKTFLNKALALSPDSEQGRVLGDLISGK